MEILDSKVCGLKSLALMAKNEKLCNKGFCLEKKYQYILDNENITKDIRITILKDEKEVIGVCYFEANDKLYPISIQAFIKEEYRRKGFGKILMRDMCLKEKSKNLIFGVGSDIKKVLQKDPVLTSCGLKFL